MQSTVNDFFRPIKLEDYPSDQDYERIKPYVRAIELASHLTYQSVYIIDYYRRGFIYVSDNPLLLCGNTPEVVMKMGYNFYLKYVPEEDLELLLEINQAGFAFYSNIKMEDRKKYSISYNFHIVQPNSHPLLINHKLAPLVLDKSGNIWLALCYVSTSSDNKSGNILIRKHKSEKVYQYDLKEKLWKLRSDLKLTAIEKEILILSCQGLTMSEIANQLFLTVNTIKFHRKKIFQILNVRNITEAISYAANYNFI
ncbi:response regulator transcription factor [Arachidicoccus soli]|uniref:LuxR family transcriptional regulator n=1 Tax=Arachidicoccus soli TaxID=2341117 RepID=A0A386HT56_9BACT|nr:helix-turn-helix transcriptional regulator [Arachidicoccus soli]AYD49065.1 LuxR family transcriptional regulator [Arachidicoccus soli]